jgi:hypothetical protein
MICEACRRDVDYVRASFWHGDAPMCRECIAQWSDPDNVQISAGDAASVGNYVRLRHGLPPLAAALAILLLANMSPAQASRRCLDQAEAARTWPTLALLKDGDGCWTYDRHPPRAEVPARIPLIPVQETTLTDRWEDADMLQIEAREFEPEPPSPPEPFVRASQVALFVALVLATMSVIEVATGPHAARSRRPRWPDRNPL